MRHLKQGAKFDRKSAHRLAMWRNMTTSLIIHERIRTTSEKAKALRTHVAKMITLAKRARALGLTGVDKTVAAKQLHLRRQALSWVKDKEAVKKLFSVLADRFADRPGGYTRILKIGNRIGDGAEVSFIELLGEEEVTETKKGGKKKAKAKTAARKPKTEVKKPKKEAAPGAEPEAAPAETPATPAAEEPEQENK